MASFSTITSSDSETEKSRNSRYMGRAEILARSSFVLAAFAFLAGLGALPFLAVSMMRPSVKLPVVGGYGILLLVMFGVLIRSWHIEPPRQIPFWFRVVRWLNRWGVSPTITLLLIELNLLAVLAVRPVVPTITALVIVFAVWSLLIFVVLLVATMDELAAWVRRTRTLWISTGITLSVLTALVLLYVVNSSFLAQSGLVNQLRGWVDYRELVLFGGKTDVEVSRAYWRELGELDPKWLPYLYSRLEGHTGDYINVSSQGLRKTARFIENDVPAVDIFVFGGSTVWGDGARDDYTIPSHLARLLHEAGVPARVTNFGQIASVSTQDLISFEIQLAKGNVPQLAVFYQGFNDIASTLMHQAAGLPHNELNRAEDFFIGRQFDAGSITLRRPQFSLDEVDFSLITSEGDLARVTADRYLANVRLIRAIAAEYGVKTLFVWQPAILYKAHKTAQEVTFYETNEAQWPSFEDFHSAVDRAVAESAGGAQDFVNLSHLFAETTEYTFIDRVHLTEDGNYRVAQALLPSIQAAIAGTPISTGAN